MENTYDKEQFDKIANLEKDVAVIKTELIYFRENQSEQNRVLLREFRKLEKKICANQKELSSDTNIRVRGCEKRFEALESEDKKIWEKISTISVFLYIAIREVAPNLVDYIKP